MKKYSDHIDMMALLGKIAPLARTLASDDTDIALQLVAQALPGAAFDNFPSGSAAWSWTIPPRWEVDSATIKSDGKTLVDVSWNPLLLINYSQAFKGTVTRAELLEHIRTYAERPEAIPFSFSFYEPVWGFSIPHAWLSRFTSDTYEIEINSRFEQGDLKTLSLHIPGDSQQTFVICSNICHPGQVNDSLTGLAVAVDIANRLLARNNRKYSYLIMVVPETIGSVAFLSRHQEVIDSSVGGFFSEMLGTDGPLVAQRTRAGNSYWDCIFADVMQQSGLPHKIVNFMQSASNDEKVLDSPGVDIPTFALTRYPYPEYHTSDDNMELIDVEKLREGRDVLQQVIDIAERDFIPVLNQPGPIFLSGHDLYPDWRNNPSLLPLWLSFVKVMYSIDGKHSVVELASRAAIPIEHYFYWVDAFAEKGLLTQRPFILPLKSKTPCH